MILILLPLFCNHNNLIGKNSYLVEWWFFTGRIKVGSVPEIINEKVLAQPIYKPA